MLMIAGWVVVAWLWHRWHVVLAKKDQELCDTQAHAAIALNEKLKEVAAVRDDFVAKASHELRTPLTAIKEGVSLISDGALGTVNAEQLDFLKIINENIDRLGELINNLLDISKKEAGRLRLFRKPLDVRPLIESTVKSYRTMAGARTLRTEFAETSPVFADPDRLLQVLGNLFSNAIKFTTDNGTITFRLAQHNGMVAVSVHDDGLGIAKEDVSRLFQKFSQVGEGENRPKGTGLGLALCKELIQLHKGTIDVTSELGKGTTVTFQVPIYTPALALEEHFADVRQLAERNQQALALLVVDARALLDRLPQERATQRAWHLEEISEVVRQNVHRGDIVMSQEPHWIVIFAVTDAAGVQTMIQRLRGVLQEWVTTKVVTAQELSVQFGAVLSPDDGTDAHELLAKATASLDIGLATPTTIGESR